MVNDRSVVLLDEPQTRELEEVLVERIYEFNAKATGSLDGKLIGGCLRSEAGDLIGGYSGHTWAGTCVVTHLWVTETSRGAGLGRLLLQSAEAEACRRKCANIILTTHSFQAALFYERLGYRRMGSVADWPLGHSNIVYSKLLTTERRTPRAAERS